MSQPFDSENFVLHPVRFVKTVEFVPAELAKMKQEDVNNIFTVKLSDILKNRAVVSEITKKTPLGMLVKSVTVQSGTTRNSSYASVTTYGYVTRNKNRFQSSAENSFLIQREGAIEFGAIMHPDCSLDRDYTVISIDDETFTPSFLAEFPKWTVAKLRSTDYASQVDDNRFVRADGPVYEWIKRKAREQIRLTVSNKHPGISRNALEKSVETNLSGWMAENYPIDENGRFKISEDKFNLIVKGIEEDNSKNLTLEHVLRGFVLSFHRFRPSKPSMKMIGNSSEAFDMGHNLLKATEKPNEWSQDGDMELARAADFVNLNRKNRYESEYQLTVLVEIMVYAPKVFIKPGDEGGQ